MRELPKGWITAALQEVAKINPTIDKSVYSDDLEISFVPMPAVEAETGKIDVSQLRKFGDIKKGYTPFLQHDVLFAKITPCMENGKMAVVPALHNDIGFGSTEFHVLRAYEGIAPRYLYYFISSKAYRYNAEHNMTGAVGQKRVPTPYIEKSHIPIPPLNEQKRIVAKIEELFSELDKGIESLKAARAQLKVYRQAVLKHAFEGKLTTDWREKNKDKLETADQLLAEIDQIAQSKRKKSKKQEQAAIETPLIIPESWEWVSLKDICALENGDRSKNYPSKGKFVSEGIAFINAGHLEGLSIQMADMNYISQETFDALRAGKVSYGDILFCLRGSLGKVALSHLLQGAIASSLVLVKPYDQRMVKFILYYLSSPLSHQMIKRFDNGTAQPNLSASDLGRFLIPLPPLNEQEIILDVLTKALSVIEKNEEEIGLQLQKSEALRQSILKKAFSGQLVAQDPADEPASVLLERIRAEKIGQSAKKNPKEKRRGV
jgi:type I restriction enzyme S subunit